MIVTPYNLPPWMCMKDEYMFLSIIVLGPKNPKGKLDVFLQHLIMELKTLWEVGVCTYDISRKQNFQLTYSMLSGWSTTRKLAYPYCMEDSDAFSLTKGGKTSWFDNHRKFLPRQHQFRRNKNSFLKGKAVKKVAPHVRLGSEILEQIEQLGLKKVKKTDAESTNAHIFKICECGWKKKKHLLGFCILEHKPHST